MTEHRQRPERESQPPPATTTHPLPDHSKRDEQEKTDVNLTYSRTKAGKGGPGWGAARRRRRKQGSVCSERLGEANIRLIHSHNYKDPLGARRSQISLKLHIFPNTVGLAFLSSVFLW